MGNSINCKFIFCRKTKRYLNTFTVLCELVMAVMIFVKALFQLVVRCVLI